MKTSLFSFIMFGLAAGTTLFTASCQKDNLQPDALVSADDAKKAAIGDLAILQFDVDKFAGNIEAYMDGKVAGYGYAIQHEGKMYFRSKGGGGWLRRPIDEPSVQHSAQQRQDIASSTKFVTALTTIALLAKYKMSLNEPVYTYLPSNWKPSATFKLLTFERLLAHTTGLNNYGGEWEGLKLAVEGPMQESEFADSIRDYDNINYALLAVILPYVSAKKEYPTDAFILKSLEGNTAQLYDALGARYVGLVRMNVFKPAGLTNWSVVNFCPWNSNGVISAANGSKGYATANGGEAGTNNGDYRRNGGAGGLYISAGEFSQIQRSAAQGLIVSSTSYKAMKDKLLGFDAVVNGTYGKYYWKNGGANFRETIIFDFGKTQVAVFANSNTSDIGNNRSILVGAYESAWVTK